MKNFISFFLILVFLMSVVGLKYYFFAHPSRLFFFLSSSDIMLKAPEFLRKPTPIPYVQSYLEYPVVIGIWGTFLAYFSRSAGDFFFLNGLFLSFFSTLNVFLARELALLAFGKKLSLFRFLTPSLIFFTFYNWEALAVFFLLLALVLFYRGQWRWAAIFSVFGFWTKIFPIFALFSFLLEAMRSNKYKKLVGVAFFSGVISLFLNLRFYLLNASGLLIFFTFSRNRPPNIDSIWTGLYLLSDRVFGPHFFFKPFFNEAVSLISLLLFLTLVGLYFLKKWRAHNFHYLLDTTFVLAAFLLTSKVYSPQFNLWLTLLLVAVSLPYKKILAFDLLDLLVAWAVYQYFWQVFIAGKIILNFPYFKFFYFFVLLRQAVLLWLVAELWRRGTSSSYEAKK